MQSKPKSYENGGTNRVGSKIGSSGTSQLRRRGGGGNADHWPILDNWPW